MMIADNTYMKTMETEIQQLFQMFEESKTEDRAERAQAAKISDRRFEALHYSTFE